MSGDTSSGPRGARRPPEARPPGGVAEERLADLLTALAPQDAGGDAVPAAVLAAFAHQARAGRSRAAVAGHGRPARSGARIRRAGRAATIKAGVVVLAVSSGTFAAAAADMLPAPAQRAAHSLFGSWGVPAPGSGSGTVSPSTSATPAPGGSATAAPGTGTARPGPSSPAPSATGTCASTSTHGADPRCAAGSANAGTAPPTPGAGHATKSADHGHTASPRSDAAR